MSLMVSLLITGCAWFPESTHRAEMMAVPAMEKTLASIRDRLPAGGRWPEEDWWTVFQIPVLDRLIETAITDNPDLKRVAARLQQSQALVDAQAAELYPTIDGNVRFSAQRFSANSTQAKLAGEHFRQLVINPLVLRYHLDLWGRDRAALQAEIGKALASKAELADARILLSVAVARSYFELAAAVAKFELAEQLVDCHERLLALAKVRLATGLAASTPVMAAEAERHMAQQQVTAVRAVVELQKNLIAVLAGKGPDWGREIALEVSTLPQRLALPSDLPLHLLAHRPDMMAARLRVEAAAQDIKVARTAFYPDVNLIAFSGLHSVSISDVLLQGSSLAYAVGPSVEFPILEGGRLRAQLSYQEAAYDLAVERYNGQLLRAVQEIADSLALWRDLDIRVTEQQQTVTAVRESRRLAETLQRAGLSDLSDSVRARAVEYQQRYRLADLEGQHFKAAVSVIKALGGGYFGVRGH